MAEGKNVAQYLSRDPDRTDAVAAERERVKAAAVTAIEAL
jgi:hypothetical protein